MDAASRPFFFALGLLDVPERDRIFDMVMHSDALTA
jgi:hypothetical protein